MGRGDHLIARRRGYRHHGIDCGDGTVVHYCGEDHEKRNAVVCRTSFEEFSKGADIVRIPPRTPERGERTVARALSRVGEREYHILRNNCEHFARWCASGRGLSTQVLSAAAFGAAMAGGAGLLIGRSLLTRVWRRA